MTKDVIGTDQAAEIAPRIDLEAGRRAFMKSIGATAVGAAVFGAAEGSFTEAYAASITDADILNFALNLEYLEASFYLFAYNGNGLPASLMGSNPGVARGGRQVSFTSPFVKAYALELATEERNHVAFLRSALGSSAVSMPNLNIGTAFQTAAVAAGINNGSSFDAYANDTNFLLASYIFEDVGVTAYHGAASLIQNKTYLDAAAGILAVEAYHSGIIRTSLFALNNPTVVQNTTLISRLRSRLANNNQPTVDDYGIGTAPNFPYLVVADSNSIAFDRTTTQVLNIVYGSLSTQPGLFFPSGMNGTIR